MPTFEQELSSNKKFIGNVVIRVLGEYFSIHTPDSGLTIKRRFQGCLAGVTVNRTTIDPKRISTSIASNSVTIVDKLNAISALVKDKGQDLVGQQVEIWIGRTGVAMDFADYKQLPTTRIKRISKQDNRYTFNTVGETERLQNPSYDLTSRLNGNILSGTTVITVQDDISEFPSSGFLKIEDEYVSYSSKNNGTKSFSGIARGEFSTTPAPHELNTAIFQAERIEDNAVNILLKLMISGGGGGPYDVLDSGLGIDPSLIDVATIEDIRDQVFNADRFEFRLILANIDKTLDFIEKEILEPCKLRFTFSQDAKISLCVLDRPQFVELNNSIEETSQASSPGLSIDDNDIINEIYISWDFDEGTQKFLNAQYFSDADSLAAYGRRQPKKFLFSGVRADLDGQAFIDEFAASFLERVANPSPTITVRTHIDKSLQNLGDKTRLESRNLANENGVLNFAEDLEILEQGINWDSHDVSFKLGFTTFTGIRSCYLAPSDSINVVNAQDEIEIGAGRGDLWEVGFKVRLWNNLLREYESDGVNEIIDINGDVITFENAFVTTLTTDHKIKFPDYDDATSRQKRYCFISDQGLPFPDSLKTYSITP